jgi:hypothetical protein
MRIASGIQFFAFGIFLLNCTKPVSKEISSEDSVKTEQEATIDTTSERQAEVSEVPDEIHDDFVAIVQQSFDSAFAVKKDESVHSMSASFQGYENSADATYYYDSALSLTYCEVMWNMEGTSGTNTYLFTADQVEAGKEELSTSDTDEVTIFLSEYRPRYGFTKTIMAEYNDEVIELDESKFISRRTEAVNEYNRIVARMLEYAQSMVVDEDGAVLELENEVEYGETFTERERFRLDLPIYEMLIVDVD